MALSPPSLPQLGQEIVLCFTPKLHSCNFCL